MGIVKAAVCKEFGKALSVENILLNNPEAEEVEISLEACAVCHSDITFMNGGWGGTLPAVYGHEAVGKISKIGSNVSLGQNVYVANKVIIGDQCKIQNNVSIYDNVYLEEGVFCGPSMVFTNVYNPRSLIERKSEFKDTFVSFFRLSMQLGCSASGTWTPRSRAPPAAPRTRRPREPSPASAAAPRAPRQKKEPEGA